MFLTIKKNKLSFVVCFQIGLVILSTFVCLFQNPTNYSKVLEILKQESDRRLYGQFVSAEMPAEGNPAPPTVPQPNQLARQMSNLMRGSLDSLDRQRSHSGSSTGPDFIRQRSDSVESRGSVASVESGTSAGRIHLQGYGGTAGSPGYLNNAQQPQAQYTSSGSLYIQMMNNNSQQPQAHSGNGHHVPQPPSGATGGSYYPPTSISYAIHTPGGSAPHGGSAIGLAVNPTSVGHSASKSPGTDRPPPPKFMTSNTNMYHGANATTQHGPNATPPRQGHHVHAVETGHMLNAGVNHNNESPSRPGNFGQQFPKTNSGSQYSSPSTPSPHRQGGLPYTPPRQITFSPTTSQSLSPVTVGSPQTGASMHHNSMMVGSPPPSNHTSQMFIQIAPGQTIPVAQIQSPSPGNPTVGYIIQHGVTTPGSGGSTPTQGSFVFIPAANWNPESGMPAQPVTLGDLQTFTAHQGGSPHPASLPRMDSFARQEDGAYAQGIVLSNSS